jgi:hypothetical protein
MATASLRHKHVRIDQTKLDKAKRILKAATDTEVLDRALTLVVTEGDIDRTLRRHRGKGRLGKVFR